MTQQLPSQFEMQILSVLWQDGPLTVRDLRARLPDGKRRAYTTVLSAMQVMEKKGFLSHFKEGTANVYQAAIAKPKVLGPFLRRMVTNIFGGSPSNAVQYLLEDNDISKEELDQIKALIDHHGDAED